MSEHGMVACTKDLAADVVTVLSFGQRMYFVELTGLPVGFRGKRGIKNGT